MNAKRQALAAALRRAGWKFNREACELAALLERIEAADAEGWGTTTTSSPRHRSPSGPERTPEVEAMTGEDYTAALEKLGLTVTEAASVLGVSLATSFRYQRGDTIPRTTVKLINAYLRFGMPGK